MHSFLPKLKKLASCLALLSALFMTAALNMVQAQSTCFPASQEIITNSNGEASNYNLVYKLSMPQANQDWNQQTDIPYVVNNAAALNAVSFTRVAYYMKLHSEFYGTQWVWVSMDAFTPNINLIGIPTGSTTWQQQVSNMNIYANSVGTGGTNTGSALVTGTGLNGNIEFWSKGYSPNNAAAIPGASESAFDFGDAAGIDENIYGSFQIHNAAAQQTVLSYNGWSDPGQTAEDLGIGTQLFGEPDWTFAQNAIYYDVKELYVFVNSSCCSGISVTASAPAIACSNGTTVLSAVVNGGSGTYTYRLNNGAPQSGNSFTVGAGTYTITAEGSGCSATSNTVVITNPSAVGVTATAPPIACNNGTTMVTATGSGGAGSFSYKINGGNAQASHTFTVGAGTHTISAIDARGCSASTTIVISQPPALTATVSVGSMSCLQTTTTLTVTASGGTGAKTYKLNNGSYQPGNSFTVSAGSHTITVKDASGCTYTTSVQVAAGGGAGVLTVAIPDVYAVNPGGNANNIYIGYGSQSLMLTANASGGTAPYTYLWSTGATAKFITVSPSLPGIYVYTVVVRDASGCKVGTGSKTVRVEDVSCGKGKITVCHKADKKGGNDLCISSNAVAAHLAHGDQLGSCSDAKVQNKSAAPALITEKMAPESGVYPNPAKGSFEFAISSKYSGKAQLEIVSVNGAVTEKRNLHLDGKGQTLRFDVARYPAGIYLLKLVVGKTTETYKIIVQ